MKNRLWIVGVATAVIVAVAAGLLVSPQPMGPAPDITLTTLKGDTLSLSQLRGKVVLVNFWATTCSTCVGEMPKMTETYRKLAPRGYEMVAIAMDYDRPDMVLDYTQHNGLPFAVALDLKGDAARAFGNVNATPTSFLIDRKGHIVQRYLGEPDFVKLDALVERLLAET